MEREKAKMHLFYTFYGIRGIRLLLIPSPISVLFNDTSAFKELTAHVDTAEKLDISNTLKGKNLFSFSGGYMDFSGMMLLISSFLGLLYGYDSRRNQGYLQFLSDSTGNKNTVLLIIFARLIILNAIFWLLSFLSLIWLSVNGIDAFNRYVLLYHMGLTFVIVFFVLLGALIGTLKRKPTQLIALPLIYCITVFLIPWSIHKTIYMDARHHIISIHNFEYDMLKMMMQLEKQLYKKFGVFNEGKGEAPDRIKAAVQESLNTDWTKLKQVEQERRKTIQNRIKTYQTLSALLPTSFYISANKELGSKGYQNFDRFYGYAFDMKFKFLKFYVKKKFYNPVAEKGIEPFIKGDEDLYHAPSVVPWNLGLGILFSILWLIVLTAIVWIRIYQIFARRPVDSSEEEPELNLKPNKTKVVITANRARVDSLIAKLRFKHANTIRVPNWYCLDNESKVSWYFSLFKQPIPEKLQPLANKTIAQIDDHQRATILVELILNLKAEVFIFDNFLNGLPDEFCDYFARQLEIVKQNRYIIYFSKSMSYSGIGDSTARFTDDLPL